MAFYKPLKLKNQQYYHLDSFHLKSGATLLISDPNVSSEKHFTISLLSITIKLQFNCLAEFM